MITISASTSFVKNLGIGTAQKNSSVGGSTEEAEVVISSHSEERRHRSDATSTPIARALFLNIFKHRNSIPAINGERKTAGATS
jgi:hypothetical protein